MSLGHGHGRHHILDQLGGPEKGVILKLRDARGDDGLGTRNVLSIEKPSPIGHFGKFFLHVRTIPNDFKTISHVCKAFVPLALLHSGKLENRSIRLLKTL